MRLFYLESMGWAETQYADPTPKEAIGLELGKRLKPNKLYILTDFEIEFILRAAQRQKKASDIKVLTQDTTAALIQKRGSPISLGNSQLEPNHISFDELLQKSALNSPVKLGIISPFGRNLGDSLMFFTVVKEYERRAAKHGKKLEIHLMNAVLPDNIGPVYRKSPSFSKISEFPCDFNLLFESDAYINFCRPHLHYDIPWIDSLFELSGIKPDSVSDLNKRNLFQLETRVQNKVGNIWEKFKAEVKKPIIIFNRESSTPIRTMPESNYKKLLKEFVNLTDYHFVSLTPIDFSHSGFTDLSSVSKSFDDYTSLISFADGFITVDTSLYHFADAFNIPGVAIFTCQPPSRFSKYYPLVKSFQIAGGEKLDLKHWSNDPADIEFADGLWNLLDSQMIIDLLNEARLNLC
jgi:hypothetical protein